MDHQIILIVDDDRDVLSAIQAVCAAQTDQMILGARDFAEALAILSTTQVDILIADVVLPGPANEDGVALSFEAIDAWPNIALVLISADAAETFDTYSKRAVCLRKPFGRDELFAAIEQATLKAPAKVNRT